MVVCLSVRVKDDQDVQPLICPAPVTAFWAWNSLV